MLALASVIAHGLLPSLRSVCLRDCRSFKQPQLELLLQALQTGRCPLDALDLGGAGLCISGPGRYSVGALRLVCGLISAPGSALRNLSLRGTHLCGLPPGTDAGESHTLEGVRLLCDALASEHCRLVELDLSDNGVQAERELTPHSRLPAALYHIERHEGPRLAAQPPAVRLRLLRLLDYPHTFAKASARGFDLPSLEALAEYDAEKMELVWREALAADSRAEEVPSGPLPDAPANSSPDTTTPDASSSAQPQTGPGPLAPPRELSDSMAEQRALPTEAVVVARPAAQLASAGAALGAAGAESGLAAAPTDSPAAAPPGPTTALAPADAGAHGEDDESLFPEIGEGDTSLMARCLSRAAFESMREGSSLLAGWRLSQVIKPGLSHPQATIGAVAGDGDCYDRFAPLFDPLLEAWHAGGSGGGARLEAHFSDLDASKLEVGDVADETWDTLASLTVRPAGGQRGSSAAMNLEMNAALRSARAAGGQRGGGAGLGGGGAAGGGLGGSGTSRLDALAEALAGGLGSRLGGVGLGRGQGQSIGSDSPSSSGMSRRSLLPSGSARLTRSLGEADC